MTMSTPVKIFTLYTLVDITHTGIVRGFDNEHPPYPDWAGQLIKNKMTWERSRNQQRNWETVVQLFNLRSKPVVLDYSKKISNGSTTNYNFGQDCVGDNCHIWSVDFEFVDINIFAYKTNQLYWLEQDFDLVPIIVQLTERININVPCIQLFGPKKNTYFIEKF